jgi:hypothetical protein
MSLEGQRILHYTILSQLETGGMGEIYLARDERFPRYVAFKAIQIDYSHSSDVAATANAEVTATITTYSNNLSANRSLVLNDPLHNDSNGWDVFQDGSCAFNSSAYHAVASSSGIAPCFAEATHFAAFSYQVTITINKGDQAGIIFCANTSNGNFYDYSINRNGSYSLRVFNGYTPNSPALAQGTSNAINTNVGKSNVIAVRIDGNAISLFINLQLITTVSDNTYSQGTIGVIAEDTKGPTDATFSNVLVWM